MRNFTYFLLTLCLVGFCFTSSFAQEQISAARKQAIDSLAMEKVRDLSRYISIIGNKDTDFSEASRVIDRAVELFGGRQ